MTWPVGTAKAIARSLDVYYRDGARLARMDALNGQFIGHGDLVFDIGAHLGDRTGSYRRLGARVVAAEPQPPIFRALRLLYGRDPQVTLTAVALGAQEGCLPFFINTANPTVSTAARALIDAAPGDAAWRDQIWDQQIDVPVTTLDRMIARHGLPNFIKIDVEGFEADVLRGLSHTVQGLAVEFTTVQRPVAAHVVARLETLGRYHYNYSLGEDHRLRLRDWVTADRIVEHIATLPDQANSGDIYAVALGAGSDRSAAHVPPAVSPNPDL